MKQAKQLTLEIVNTETCPENYLNQVGRPEMNLLIYMLAELSLKRDDLKNLKLDYLSTLPPSARESLSLLQKAVGDPNLSYEEITALSTQIQSPDKNVEAKARAEFLRLAKESGKRTGRPREITRVTGRLWRRHEPRYLQSPGWYARYAHEKNGYTFFRLVNEEGDVVALATGNAGKIATDPNVDKTQLRLLNIIVNPEYRGQQCGENLIGCISHYAAGKKYDKIVMPLSMPSLAKANPEKYAFAAKALNMEPTNMQAHPSDPLSIEFGMTPKLFMAQQESQRRETKHTGMQGI